ncbi:MAG: ATP-binding protein [Bradymonadia bacterium]
MSTPITPTPYKDAPQVIWIGSPPGPSWEKALSDFAVIQWANVRQGVMDPNFKAVFYRGSADTAVHALPALLQDHPKAPVVVLDLLTESAEVKLLEMGAEAVLSGRASERLIKARLRRVFADQADKTVALPDSPTPPEMRAHQYNQRMMALSQASRMLTTMDDEDAIFQNLVEMVARQLKSQRVSIMSVDREAGELQMTAAVGIPAHVIKEARSKIGEGIAGTCAALGKPLFIDDHLAARGSTDLQRYVPTTQKRDRSLPMSLTVPLKMKGEVVGVVNVTDRVDSKPYSKSDISFIQALLGQAGFLMENARLMSHMKALKAFNDEVIDTLWDPLCVFDNEGRILRPNDRFRQIFGNPEPGAILAQHIQLAEDLQYKLSGEITGAEMEGGRRHLGEWNINDRVFDVTLAPFSNPSSAQFLLFLHDQTGKRQMERRLVAAEKMASLGVLAAGVAHEINNPLAFVKANTRRAEEYFTDLLDLISAWHAAADAAGDLDAFKGPRNIEDEIDLSFLTEDIGCMVKESIEGVERVEKIVLGLKSFAHPDNQTVHRSDITSLIDNAIMLTKGKWKYTLDVVKAFEEVPQVWCLPTQLEQVFMNLIVNAAQATPEWGTLTISASSMKGGVQIDFSDQGKGIPEEVRARIFEPFFTTKDIGEGTGLGLAIAYNILENHGGEISVLSEIGKGTTFRLWLPKGEKEKPIVVEQASRFRI